MTFFSTYNYKERSIFDLETLLITIRFIVINSILTFIFIFLTIEEFEWSIFSYIERITDKIVDETSWNIKSLFL